MGPNEKKLVAHRMAHILVPPGTENPYTVCMTSLEQPMHFTHALMQANAWAWKTIRTVRDVCKSGSDESIAKDILAKFDELIRKRKDIDPDNYRKIHRMILERIPSHGN